MDMRFLQKIENFFDKLASSLCGEYRDEETKFFVADKLPEDYVFDEMFMSRNTRYTVIDNKVMKIPPPPDLRPPESSFFKYRKLKTF